jgi:hypothetical protein
MGHAHARTPTLTCFLVLLFAACSASTTATQTTTSGIEGRATIGPMCPVVQVGTPCPDQPLQATITVFDETRSRVTQFQTDAQGVFKIGLAPGTYILVPESPDGFAHAGEQSVTVAGGAFTQVTIAYDSGIR